MLRRHKGAARSRPNHGTKNWNERKSAMFPVRPLYPSLQLVFTRKLKLRVKKTTFGVVDI